jgi:hypothetical protein
MNREELGPSLLADFAHVPDLHSPCAPDSGRPVYIRVPTAPQAALYVRARRGWAGEMPAHPTCSFRVGALSKPQERGYFFFSGSKPWRIEVRPR